MIQRVLKTGLIVLLFCLTSYRNTLIEAAIDEAGFAASGTCANGHPCHHEEWNPFQHTQESSFAHPVVLIPGDGGSRLEMKLNRTVAPHPYCQQRSEWTSIWVNYEFLAPYLIDCWVEGMRLEYDVASRTTRSPHGVMIRVPGWGDPESVEYVDTLHLPRAAYYAPIVNALVRDVGLVRNVSLRGAPYDFRRGPNEQEEFYEKLPQLIEDTFIMNGNKTVLLVCHSMGCPLTKFALNRRTSAEWRKEYVRGLVALAGAWGGSVKALKAFASGDSFGIPFASLQAMRREERSCPSLAFLSPSQKLYRSDEILIETTKRNYTLRDYDLFFSDIGFLMGSEVMKDVQPWQLDESAPGLETFCIHGEGVPTVERLVYKKGDFPDGEPSELMGDGDGSVNIRALRNCGRFSMKQSEGVHMHALAHVTHMGILKDPQAILLIKSIVKGKPAKAS